MLIFLVSCGNTTKKSTPKQDKPMTEKQVSVPDFNADSAYQFVADQLAFGPRVPESEAHKKCGNYLETTLKKYTPYVIRQQFQTRLADKRIVRGSNFIASFKPESKKRILLCAHWDARPFADKEKDPSKHNTPIDGANDGASGVGILLEIARQLNLQETEMGIDIIFFDLEDSGTYGSNDSWALGSKYWSKNPHVPNYRARFGILLDMVGVANPYFTHEAVSRQYAPDILRKIWAAAKSLGYGTYFVDEKTGGIYDDHVPINQNMGIPTIDIIHYDSETSSGFFPHWHTLGDNLESIDKNTLKIVGQTVLAVIYQEK